MKTCILLSLLGLTFAVNRDQGPNANPVYSPGGVSFQGSNTNSNQDHQPAASSNSYQSLNPQGASSSPQGATYYYYYPQAEKPKEGYQGAASNQYAAAVNPNGQESNLHGGHEPVGASTDLSYSHELGSNLGSPLHDAHPGSGPSSGAGGYDLSQLAAQYAAAQGGQQGGPGGSYNPNLNPAYPTGNSYPDPSQYHGQGGENAFAGSAPVPSGYPGQPLGYVPGGPQGGSSFPYGAQAFGNYASGSSQSNSYEPSTGSRFGKIGLGSIIMPMLALAGLSLLIPTVTSLSGLSSSSSSAASSRRKRSTDGNYEPGIGGIIDRMDRYYSMYKMAVEKEDCMNRIICQLGDAVSDVKHKDTFFMFLDKIPPQWMGNKVKVFKKGALGSNYNKCKQYTCPTNN